MITSEVDTENLRGARHFSELFCLFVCFTFILGPLLSKCSQLSFIINTTLISKQRLIQHVLLMGYKMLQSITQDLLT